MVTVKAAAKINLSLDLTGKRPDGYHTLDTVMQSVSLCDRITLSVHPGQTITMQANYGPGGRENICYRAAALFRSVSGVADGVDIRLDKVIPLAAGMGGGSADAAAVLWGLNELYRRPLNAGQLEKAAVSLGADVPFFLKGGCCRATGIGEKLEPLPRRISYALVLIKASEKSSTGAMYQALDRQKAPQKNGEQTVRAIRQGDYDGFCRSLNNAFLTVDRAAVPLLTALREAGADGVNLTGSGPTVYGVFSDMDRALAAATVLKQSYERVYTALPVDFALSLE